MSVSRKLSPYLNAWTVSAIVLFVIDRTAKHLARSGMHYRGNHVVEFYLFNNNGIAFSLPMSPKIFWPIALIVFAALVALFVRAIRVAPALVGVYLMVLLGALSNLIDRHYGAATVDYLILFSRSAINLADVMIVVALAKLCFGRPAKPVASQGSAA